MAERESMASSRRKQAREPPAVPFLWEERPGIPKKDWTPGFSSNSSFPTPTPPVKLIASVPFKWEEKPGTPLPSFLEPTLESVSPRLLITYPSPPICSDHDDYDGESEGGDREDGRESMYKLELEPFDFETDDSFCSAPSLLANCLVSSLAISTAVPAHTTKPTEDKSGWSETPSSPASETGSTTSSYATGASSLPRASSLAGASFLEYLFPLLPANGAGFLEKIGQADNSTLIPPELKSKPFDRESNNSVMIRRPTTLGELILMGRKSSYRRKAVQMRKHNLSQELTKNGALGCCIIGSGIKMIEGLYSKRKHFPGIKLV